MVGCFNITRLSVGLSYLNYIALNPTFHRCGLFPILWQCLFYWNKANGTYHMIIDATNEKSELFKAKANCHEIGINCQHAIGANILASIPVMDHAVRLHCVDLKSKQCGDLAAERPMSNKEQMFVIGRYREMTKARNSMENLLNARYDKSLSPEARNYVEMALLDMMPRWYEKVES